MKQLLLGALLLCILFSCKKEDGFDFAQYPQKWQLVKMAGQIPNSETTGANMAWQEFYLLRADGTFKKSRERNGQVTEASGTYTIVTLADSKYLKLTYESDNSLIGSCTQEPTEELAFRPDNKLISSWQACDGPGLEYSRITAKISE
ncbi:hypothetical protein [Pontibacter liquoris]|uniref:hypothetical protein n=1 Tax=Pontibacter liquoris TaxID=2905677 RepID=UPI001FA702DF|nr:hypothetical protein [Pontibacter liquoris]